MNKTFVASFLGWTLDAFDFFLVTFVVARVASDFHRAIPQVLFAVTLTLACRPLGALLFGWAADRYGRRVPLMIDIACYSAIELATAFSPNFIVFIVLRGLYGVAMGGEWGLGAALAMESLPSQRRGIFSGLLQQGYAVGYLVAAVIFGLFFNVIGWRGMFAIGVLPALLIFYIRKNVPESHTWLASRGRVRRARLRAADLARYAPLFIYTVLLMAAFNFMSHGTQDLYPTFLEKQRGLSVHATSLVAIIYNVGAIAGGVVFAALSQRIGRRAGILIAAALGILTIPLWAHAPTTLLLGAGGFLLQFMVQGAWGIVPAHLNEISPSGARGTFPGLTYQLGNLISAPAAQLEATIAKTHFAHGGTPDYAAALSFIALVVFIAVLFFTAIGYFVVPERRSEALA